MASEAANGNVWGTGGTRPFAALLRTADGMPVGEVDELLLDLNSGRIAFVVVETPDDGRRQIPWSAVAYRDGEFRLRSRAAC